MAGGAAAEIASILGGGGKLAKGGAGGEGSGGRTGANLDLGGIHSWGVHSGNMPSCKVVAPATLKVGGG